MQPNPEEKVVVLLSGGMDSSTLAAWMVRHKGADNVISISVYYGQRHARELASAKAIAEWLGIRNIQSQISVDISGVENVRWLKSALTDRGMPMPKGKGPEPQRLTVVPLRNLLLVTIAAQIGTSIFGNVPFSVAYAAHKDDQYSYPDCRPEFVREAAEAIFLGSDRQVRLEAPFVGMTKAEIAALAAELGVPLELTWSCYVGGETPCGSCPSCIAREEALHEAGIGIA